MGPPGQRNAEHHGDMAAEGVPYGSTEAFQNTLFRLILHTGVEFCGAAMHGVLNAACA